MNFVPSLFVAPPLFPILSMLRRTCASSLTVTKSLSPPRSLPPLLLLRFCRPADSISFDMSLPSNEEGKRLLSAEAISLGGRTDAGATPGPSEVRCPSHHRRSPHPLRPLFVPLAPWAAAGVTSPSKPGSRRDIPFLLKPLSLPLAHSFILRHAEIALED